MEIQHTVINLVNSISKKSFQEVLLNVSENLVSHLNATGCIFFIVEDDEVIPDVFTIIGKKSSLQSCEGLKPSGKSMSSWVAQNGQLLVLDDTKNDSRYDEEIKLLGSIVYNKPVIAAVPLICLGNLVGVLDVVANNGDRINEDKILEISPLINITSFVYSRQHSDSVTKLAEICMQFLEGRDHYTYGHSLRVTNYSSLLADELGLSDLQKQKLRLAAILHDIGKITFSDTLFITEKPLTKLETQLIKMHPIIGANIVSEINKGTASIIRSHHEYYDGNGYPDGLKAKNIPLMSRIISVGDALDAMLTVRPYHSAMDINTAIQEVTVNSGRQFDPQIVEVLIKCHQTGKLHCLLLTKPLFTMQMGTKD